jgi:predicted Ser/Thr protein kinase
MTVLCPSCKRESNGGNFCSWCAARLDATSAETELIGASASPSAPHLSSSASVDEGRFLPGTILAGRYRVAGLLGRGGMGEVYRATDLTLGQAVALKFLPEGLARDERALARFYNEVRTARQVTHPNVCRVYDIGQVEGVPYISMEFVDGENLASLLRRIGRLPADKALETARRLCAGLAAAHERNVLHRDLKPANVMIDSRGQVIIMDFGLAGISEQLQNDVRSGTPAYMSPEQLAGKEVTFQSDIYALGLVLYEVFTGKHAFEASSMMELMDLQQRGAPASLSSTVKDLDPAVERIILSCLAPNPAQRPPSTLAVAAALPGGDALAQALAAGETPSPELVAAAGETEGLQPKVAMAWLAAALACIAAVAVLAPTQDITTKVPLENPPEALARDARKMLSGFGYTARPQDTAWGFSYSQDYRDYLREHPDEARTRWKDPAASQPPVIGFWYRESPAIMAAGRHLSSVMVVFDDPPMEMSGMLRVRLDPDGKLRQLEAVPPQVEPPAPPGSFAWSGLFQAAGLDLAQFQPAEPQWTPLANWDQRAAWTSDRLRVEAAAWRGHPVFFRLIGPWTTPERTKPPGSEQQIAQLSVIYSALLAACVIAWLNFRSGRVSLQGAGKLAGVFFAAMALDLFLFMHHSTSAAELDGFWRVVSMSAINACAAWVFYLALEPWVRRRWPQTMISWNRFVVKGIHDPLVGRDLLYGVAVGGAAALLGLSKTALGAASAGPNFPSLEALKGVRYLIGESLATFAAGLFETLLTFFLLFLLRVMLRKQWIAVAAFIPVGIALNISVSSDLWLDLTYALIFALIWMVVLLRFGLLATMVADAARGLLMQFPRTLDLSAWYAATVAVPLIVIALVAVYGFRNSLGGRRLIQVLD